MLSALLLRRNPHDQSRLAEMTRGWRRLIGIWALVIGHSLIPNLVWAHGDDDVTAASFLGPLILVAVLAAGLSIGRSLVLRLARRG